MEKSVISKVNKFFSKYQAIELKKGEILIRADETPSSIFCLKDGIVKMYAISPNGEELIINVYRPVSFFPVSYVCNNSSNRYFFETLTPAFFYKAPPEQFLLFLKENNDVLLDLVSRIYHGLDGFFLRMEYLMAGSAGKRLLTELLIFAKRFGQKTKGSTLINLKLTEKNLASISGITRETVSREIQKLKKIGLLSYKKSVLTINDLKKLEEELFT